MGYGGIMDQNYIRTLSEEEKVVFIKLFYCLIKIDGEVDQEEIAFIKSITKEYGIDIDTSAQIIKNIQAVDYKYEASKIKNRSHALELLKELCFLANIDNTLHDKELDFIINVAHAMNIEDEKLVLINRFVLDNIILYKTGQLILEKEDGEI